MHNLFALIIIATIFFNGCSTSKIQPSNKSADLTQSELYYEDSLILYGLRAEEIKDYQSASELFYKLYTKNKQKEYLYHSLQNDINAKNFLKVLDKIKQVKDKKDITLKKYELIVYISQNKLQDAKVLAHRIVDITKEVDDYIRLADIYILLKEPKISLQYLEKAYTINYDNVVIEKIATLLYNYMNKKENAIKRLEIHREIHGNSTVVLLRLGHFYSNQKNLEKLLSTCISLYKLDKKEDVAAKIIQIYEYKRDYLSLKDFLEENHINDARLLQLYVVTKNYDNASKLAYTLYQKEGSLNYLGESALYEYEYYKITKDKTLLDKIINKLKDLLSQSDEALYNNYLGYLLIDHEIDVKKGILYVKKALAQEPNSVYILDSLAWGYLKLGRCQQADLIMQNVLSKGSNDNEEIAYHKDVIEKCKNQRRKK